MTPSCACRDSKCSQDASKFHMFHQRVVLGAPWFYFDGFWMPLGIILALFWLLWELFWLHFSCFCTLFAAVYHYLRSWGGSGGVGNAQFLTLPSLASNHFSITPTDWHGAALLCNLDKLRLSSNLRLSSSPGSPKPSVADPAPHRPDPTRPKPKIQVFV